MSENIDFAATVARVKDKANLPDIAGKYRVEYKTRGREFSACCPFHDERTASFTMFRKGGDWRYHCFGCGRGGDAIGFVMEMENIDFREAVTRLARDAGVDGPESAIENHKREARRRRQAERMAEQDRLRNVHRHTFAASIWRAAGTAEETEASRYLHIARGYPAGWEIPPTIRHIKARDLARIEADFGWRQTDQYSAMVGAVQDVTGKLVAVHLTFLLPDGSGRPDIKTQKRMIGPVWGGAVRLGPVAPCLYIAEGIETALSVLAALTSAGMDGSVWAALSLGNIAGKGAGKGKRRGRSDPRRDMRGHFRLPSETPDFETDSAGLLLPPECNRVVICADGDGKDPPAAAALIKRAETRYRATVGRVGVAQPPPGMDFNDLLMEGIKE